MKEVEKTNERRKKLRRQNNEMAKERTNERQQENKRIKKIGSRALKNKNRRRKKQDRQAKYITRNHCKHRLVDAAPESFWK